MPRDALCEVCGLVCGDADVCPRCGTVLRIGRARCETCGEEFSGLVASCDRCGTLVPAPADAPADSIRRLTLLPGIDDRTARWLYGHGYAEPADVLGLALPERAVRIGLHRTLARKLAIQGLRAAPRIRKEVPCPVCETPKPSANAICPACGARGEREPTPEEIQRQLATVVGEVHDLAADPDFLEMPTELRDEILDAFAGVVGPVSPPPLGSTAYAPQLREWRSAGIDTSLLEQILSEEGEASFRRKYGEIVRRQIAKRREAGRFWCPICDEELAPDEPECENCGAKFR